DLKRQAVPPERLALLAESPGASEKSRELAAIYSKYQKLLSQRQLFDAEEQFLLAGEVLKNRPGEEWGPLAESRLIVVDGFSDFTAAQHAILEVFREKATKLQDLMISLPLEEPCDRDDLFNKPTATYQELKRRHRTLQTRWINRAESPGWAAMNHIERYLFSNPRSARMAANTRGIEIVQASGQRAEIEILARRIKNLLVLGDPSRSIQLVRPGEIAIVFRSLETIAPLVEEIFTEHG